MAEREEPLGSSDASIARVVVRESEATARGDDVEVGPRESLLPLQDLWYCSSFCSQQLGPLRSAHLGCQRSGF